MFLILKIAFIFKIVTMYRNSTSYSLEISNRKLDENMVFLGPHSSLCLGPDFVFEVVESVMRF